MHRTRLAGLATIICAAVNTGALAQLRIVCWNTHEDGYSSSLNAGTELVLEAIGDASVNGIAKPPDVLILQEMSYGHGAANAFVSALNALYGGGTYARANQQQYEYNMPVNVVYNTTTVALEDTYYFKYSTSPRYTGRYRFGVAGYGDDADLYVYNTHYKAGTTTSDQNRRADEAWNIRINADDLPASAYIIYAGDYNARSSYEDGYNNWPNLVENPYATIKAASMPPGTSGNGVGVDPINRAGVWHDSTIFRDIHSQAPGSIYTSGGMDDRYDIQQVCTELSDGEGLSYIGPGVGDCTAGTHSYHALGNNGSHNLNQSISTGTGADPNVLAALETASDHLPVILDLQVPADMEVDVGTIPSQVIVGATVPVDVTVTNVADVDVVVGGDELDYALGTTGDVTGSASDTDQPLGGANTHQVNLAAGSPGGKTGEISVTSASQAVANGSSATPVDFDVLGHAEASFQSGANQDVLDIDFGTIRQGRPADAEDFDVHNLESTPNYTAALDIDSVGGTGDTTVLTTDLAPTSGIAAGGSAAFSASLDTTNHGTFFAAYTADVSDEDLPGAMAGVDLTLDLTATVSLLGDVDLDGDTSPNDIDAHDINTLRSRFGTSDMYADLDDSGTVDQADLDKLIRDIIGTEYGDINLDGQVDESDYVVYALNYGQAGGWAAGDLNGDGMVTGADYTIYGANYGFGTGE